VQGEDRAPLSFAIRNGRDPRSLAAHLNAIVPEPASKKETKQSPQKQQQEGGVALPEVGRGGGAAIGVAWADQPKVEVGVVVDGTADAGAAADAAPASQ
jgi:hypothetical protein